ncbi:MAG: FixH family protein [Saprospiraceae bacterium]|nr:FixH family protein [Saprospiraceae bacterium]
MKFNWGTGIAIFLILFIGALIWVLYQSRQVDNSLVSDTYYQEDLMYQKKYEKLENYAKLTEKVNIQFTAGDKNILIKFPVEEGRKHSGTITLYRANKISEDKMIPFSLLQDSIFSIPVEGLDSGKWSLKMDWKWGKTSLFSEQLIVIP